MNRKQVDNKAHRYALEEKDFIPIDQIGELDYNPHVRLSN